MASKKFILFLASIFIATITLVVFIQYTSNRNIDSLIEGNQELLTEFEVKNVIQELIGDLSFISTEERKIISHKVTESREVIDKRIKKVFDELAYLKTISVNADTKQKLNELEQAVKDLLGHYNTSLDIFFTNPHANPDELLAYSTADTLTNQILAISNYLTASKDKYLVGVIERADRNARAAKKLGFVLAFITIVASIYTFVFILTKVQKQLVLIKRLNESEQKVREAASIKENFMANMSHEIRTPMNAILGFTHLLQKEPLSEKGKEFLNSIQNSGENLLTIINDVLDFSKIEAGMMRIESIAFSPRGLLHSVETMFKTKAELKNLWISLHIEEAIPEILNGDAVRLTQIMVNLVNNSLKFTNTGGIDITVKAIERSDENILLSFSVKDTGIGIPPDKIATIFDRFQQADEDTTRKYGGTGLGLSIVKELVDLQNGNITVTSTQNKGTEFIFTIPYTVANHIVEKELNVISDHRITVTQNDVLILVVEDNVMNQNLIKHLLTDWSLKFDIVNNGQEAIEAIRKKNYEFILMDIQMPVMDGYTATGIIRNELKSNIPIIAMTAHAMAGEREKCLSYGMSEYISKPIRENELFKIINNILIRNGQLKRPERHAGSEAKNQFQVLNLQYLKELSGGNITFEKSMIEQFLNQVPGELALMESELNQSNYTAVAQVAHNMKTSVSFMGLLEKVGNELDEVEGNAATLKNDAYLRAKIAVIKQICQKAFIQAEECLTGLS
jgi:signal transduction histidine kinase/CheY-like chemotaxis protein